MYVFIFGLTFMINFALYQAGPQNYANQGFDENGPPSPQVDYYASTNGNKNRHTRQSGYTRYFDGEKEILSVGNGNNKKNVFYIDGIDFGTNTNNERKPNNFDPSRTNSHPIPEEGSSLGNRFGSDIPNRDRPRINSFGNGFSNSHTFFINDLDGDTTVKVYDNNQPPNFHQSGYQPNTNNANTNTQRNINEDHVNRNNGYGQNGQPDFRPRTDNNGNTNTRRNNEGSSVTYNRIGEGQDNTNVLVMNGKPSQPGLNPSINNNANTNIQRHVVDSTNTHNIIGQGQNNKNLFRSNSNPVQGFDTNINTFGNTYTPRNFREGNHAIPTNTFTYNNIGNGVGNRNLFVVNNKGVIPDSMGSVNNNNMNNPGIFNQGTNFNNKGTTDIRTYSTIGRGPNNRNVFVTNGETVFNSNSGISVATRERHGQGEPSPCDLRGTCHVDSDFIKRKIENGINYILGLTISLNSIINSMSEYF